MPQRRRKPSTGPATGPSHLRTSSSNSTPSSRAARNSSSRNASQDMDGSGRVFGRSAGDHLGSRGLGTSGFREGFGSGMNNGYSSSRTPFFSTSQPSNTTKTSIGKDSGEDGERDLPGSFSLLAMEVVTGVSIAIATLIDIWKLLRMFWSGVLVWCWREMIMSSNQGDNLNAWSSELGVDGIVNEAVTKIGFFGRIWALFMFLIKYTPSLHLFLSTLDSLLSDSSSPPAPFYSTDPSFYSRSSSSPQSPLSKYLPASLYSLLKKDATVSCVLIVVKSILYRFFWRGIFLTGWDKKDYGFNGSAPWVGMIGLYLVFNWSGGEGFKQPALYYRPPPGASEEEEEEEVKKRKKILERKVESLLWAFGIYGIVWYFVYGNGWWSAWCLGSGIGWALKSIYEGESQKESSSGSMGGTGTAQERRGRSSTAAEGDDSIPFRFPEGLFNDPGLRTAASDEDGDLDLEIPGLEDGSEEEGTTKRQHRSSEGRGVRNNSGNGRDEDGDLEYTMMTALMNQSLKTLVNNFETGMGMGSSATGDSDVGSSSSTSKPVREGKTKSPKRKRDTTATSYPAGSSSPGSVNAKVETMMDSYDEDDEDAGGLRRRSYEEID